jgi:AcrR family transcriptional regulator
VFKVSTDPATETEAAAAVPPPPWQRMPDRPARRRRDPISREAIVETAVRLLDAEGLDALSMRGIADELGTGAASLYWHVGSKDGLLDLVMDHVIGEQRVPDPEPGRWPEQLRELARQQREICLRHTWIVEVSIGRIPMGPNALNFSERVLAILKSGGVPDTLAVQGYLLMISTVNGFMLDEVGDAQPGAPAGVPQEAADMASQYVASLPTDRFPNMVALAPEFARADPEERFELLLDIFVSGIVSRASAQSGA